MDMRTYNYVHDVIKRVWSVQQPGLTTKGGGLWLKRAHSSKSPNPLAPCNINTMLPNTLLFNVALVIVNDYIIFEAGS